MSDRAGVNDDAADVALLWGLLYQLDHGVHAGRMLRDLLFGLDGGADHEYLRYLAREGSDLERAAAQLLCERYLDDRTLADDLLVRAAAIAELRRP